MAGSLVIEKDERKEPYWVSYIHGRIKKKKNFLGFISGPTGSGKSWTGISICLMLDKTFGSERIVTSMKQLMRLINSGKVTNGSAILWDEAGIDISSKSWQSITNKLINFLMQTFRHKRFILIFTSPHLDFIDASTRKMFHAEFQTVSIDYEKKTNKIKPFLIQYNGRKKKFYYKYLRVRTKKKTVVPLRAWNVPKPPKWVIEEYEKIKEDFTTKLNKDIEQQLNELDKSQGKSEKKPLTDIQHRVMELMGKYDNVAKVAEELGYTEQTIYFHINQSHKKMWEVKDFVGDMGVRTPKLG